MDLLTDPSLTGLAWVALIALAVIVIDTFLETDMLGMGALLALSTYFALLFDASNLVRVVVALFAWVAAVAAFQFGWKRLIAPGLRGVFGAGIPEARSEAVGAVGEFRRIDGRAFVYWNGDLWPVDLDGDGASTADPDDRRFADRQKVRIAAARGGVFTIAPHSPGD